MGFASMTIDSTFAIYGVTDDKLDTMPPDSTWPQARLLAVNFQPTMPLRPLALVRFKTTQVAECESNTKSTYPSVGRNWAEQWIMLASQLSDALQVSAMLSSVGCFLLTNSN